MFGGRKKPPPRSPQDRSGGGKSLAQVKKLISFYRNYNGDLNSNSLNKENTWITNLYSLSVI